MSKKLNPSFFEQCKLFLGLEEMKEVKKIPTSSQSKANNYASLTYFKKTLSEIKIIAPKNFSDVATIAELLKQDTPVIVKLQYLNKIQKNRFLDFLSGTLYSLNGNATNLSENVMLFCSGKVKITEENVKKSNTRNNANEEIVMNMMTVN